MARDAVSAEAARAALERFTRLHPKLIDLTLGRTERLLSALGDPHRALPPVFHVAGTNGKGSTVAFLRAMLEADGRRVHVYTSPHLVRFNERIVLAGREVDDPTLAALLEEVEVANAGQPITFFEVTTAAAFLAFARIPADAVLLEVGLGGRFDATNVVADPATAVITPVSLDHREFLGERIDQIAGEKAGIVKPGATVVVAPQAVEAAGPINAAIAAAGARPVRHGLEWRFDGDDTTLRIEGPHRALTLPVPSLAGRHQHTNAATAVATLEALDEFRLSEAAYAAGLRSARWPARLQKLTGGRIAAMLPPETELLLDGGHNVAAAEALAAECRRRGIRPRLVVGMLGTKDMRAFLSTLAPVAAGLEAVPVPDSAAGTDPATLAAVAAECGIAARAHAALSEAITSLAGSDAPVLICGSLYLAGAVLRFDEGG